MKKKLLVALAAFACVVAIVAISVLSTIAYFTSSAVLSNTFTIGNVGITLTESKVNAEGVKQEGTTTEGNTYRLVPGTTYVKDPVISVTKGSEESYLFVMIRNDIEKIEIESDTTNAEGETETIEEQMFANGWKLYTSVSTGKVYIYCGTTGVAQVTEGPLKPKGIGNLTGSEDIKVPVFQNFTVTADAKIDTKTFNAATIMVRAFAVQTQGFEDDKEGTENRKFAYDKAWAALTTAYPYIHTGSTT
jgi:predicted ribosomally synthesized peptide with SipW-like signal peptide